VRSPEVRQLRWLLAGLGVSVLAVAAAASLSDTEKTAPSVASAPGAPVPAGTGPQFQETFDAPDPAGASQGGPPPVVESLTAPADPAVAGTRPGAQPLPGAQPPKAQDPAAQPPAAQNPVGKPPTTPPAAGPTTQPTVKPTSTTATPKITGKLIIGAASRRCVDVTGESSADGTRLQLWDCTGKAWQRWEFRSDGSVRSQSMCMDLARASQDNGTAIQIARCNGGWAQRFTLNAAGDLVNPTADKCVTVTDLRTDNSAPLELWDCAGTGNQKWRKA
jgi:hypothetical protein